MKHTRAILMHANHSPWLYQLNRERPAQPLDRDAAADVAIVGGGIAGITTAFFTLRDTPLSVVLLEADKVAHGATGHNAGQLVAYFERPFHEIVEEFGPALAREGLEAIRSGWDLLDLMYREAGARAPLSKFIGYAGCTNFGQVVPHLKNNAHRIASGLSPHPIFISAEAAHAEHIPSEYRGAYSLVPGEKIRELLQTKDPEYIAALGSQKGCLNSALFTEEVAGFLLAKYPERFTLAERTPARTVRLFEDRAEIDAPQATVRAKRVVLCTNGFESIHIENNAGEDIDEEFHHMVKGSIGYMAAYIDPANLAPSATSYFPPGASDAHKDAFDADPYFYLTRRHYPVQGEENSNLVCIGGPEKLIEDTTEYSKHHPFPREAHEQVDRFLKQSYAHAPEDIGYHFLWHGLMGYTPNGIRRIGPEPCNPILLYNLGCNGVGLLPSIYGGYKISRFLNGEHFPPSIFDVPDVRKTGR